MSDFTTQMRNLRDATDRMREVRKQCINDVHLFRQDLHKVAYDLQQEANQLQDNIRKERSERRREVQQLQENALNFCSYHHSQRAHGHAIWFGTKST